MEGTTMPCPSAASKCESVKLVGRIVRYQSRETDTKTTLRLGSAAERTINESKPVAPSPFHDDSSFGTPSGVALGGDRVSRPPESEPGDGVERCGRQEDHHDQRIDEGVSTDVF